MTTRRFLPIRSLLRFRTWVALQVVEVTGDEKQAYWLMNFPSPSPSSVLGTAERLSTTSFPDVLFAEQTRQW